MFLSKSSHQMMFTDLQWYILNGQFDQIFCELIKRYGDNHHIDFLIELMWKQSMTTSYQEKLQSILELQFQKCLLHVIFNRSN